MAPCPGEILTPKLTLVRLQPAGRHGCHWLRQIELGKRADPVCKTVSRGILGR
jgi:hypothetical protein